MNLHDEVRRILNRYRNENDADLRRRRDEVYKKIPDYENLVKERKELGNKYINLFRNSEDSFKQKDEILIQIKDLDSKLTELLIGNGYAKDYLKKWYHCELCKDTGVVNGKNCNCKQRILTNLAYKQSEIEEMLKVENFDKFDIEVFRDYKKDDEDVSPRDMMEFYLKDLQKYAYNFNDNNGESLLITGPVGVGKTYICNSIAKEVIDQGYSVIYKSSPNLMKSLWDYYYSSFENKQSVSDRYNLLRNCDLLVIDDLGSENISETSISHFFELINYRMQQSKATIISTNLTVSEIRNNYDERIASRIIGTYEIFIFYGDDIRFNKLKGL